MSYRVATRIAQTLFPERHLPKWVIKPQFYADKARQIQEKLREAVHENMAFVSFACCEDVLTGFVSEAVDIGASGGFDGKYQDAHVTFSVHTGTTYSL